MHTWRTWNVCFVGKLGKLRPRTQNQLTPGCPVFQWQSLDGGIGVRSLGFPHEPLAFTLYLTWQREQHGLSTLGSGRYCRLLSELIFLFRLP